MGRSVLSGHGTELGWGRLDNWWVASAAAK